MFWVGGSGNYSDATNHWSTTSGGSPGAGNLPTAADDAVFDSLSNATAYTVTFDTAVAKVCKDLKFLAAPATSGTITWAGTQSITISGSLLCLSGMTRTYSGAITFNATSTGQTVTMNGVSLASAVTFNGSGGDWTLQDGFSIATSTITLTTGTLNTNGVAVTCGVFSSAAAGTRTLTLGASSFTVSATGNSWNVSSTLTLNANTSTIKQTDVSGDTTFTGAGLTYYNLEISGGIGTKTTFTGSNTFNNIVYVTNGIAHQYLFTAGTTTTFSNMTFQGPTFFTIKSVTTATHALVKTGLGAVTGACVFLISYSVASPANTFFGGPSSSDIGNNTGWLFGSAFGVGNSTVNGATLSSLPNGDVSGLSLIGGGSLTWA